MERLSFVMPLPTTRRPEANARAEPHGAVGSWSRSGRSRFWPPSAMSCRRWSGGQRLQHSRQAQPTPRTRDAGVVDPHGGRCADSLRARGACAVLSVGPGQFVNATLPRHDVPSRRTLPLLWPERGNGWCYFEQVLVVKGGNLWPVSCTSNCSMTSTALPPMKP
jgi:hypothetical protein